MRANDRGLRQSHDLIERTVRNVRDIDHDPEAVHLGNHVPAERTEPIPLSLAVERGITDMVALRMGEGDIPYPPLLSNLKFLGDL